MVPPEVILAGESGIFSVEDVERMAAVGVDTVLVGESLIVQSDRAAAVGTLRNVKKAPRV
jgi:indole-3-glycerol phosphate synthase